ncbi:UDP-3-O-acyl-N-acetylglucosamine deacetylase [Planktothrix agardhii]|uniref:UDP-3-O-acyl-N-acetylglucosamine deacetylase n=1 Tax=Planktothrix agardhii TaxID=1160 RepID=A0A1J1JN26_PLAAG|nr:UDP-3-O-acyl-N-acetylglucosamine deacetylase [Planktothrix agardhii]MCF3607507.1 UDP-3-O-acyl-N-acetylglucosamine deacetylase [Planktothrix agardhii 1033]BBD55569.1 UDP-3-O-[3-hydroxymyristoyl] N-acetylglucosamine deacetylase [Planktothrix agardhii NIES-204]MBG0745589.1 UDP-3-O-acyl-N-acetylglucosamine deacetylase [Planktothrix agardhii KL2]MCB8751598.1 UDP-3-O-acyl-N-acetylglucosamine deacetylase [Planktothrix agardhii 1810]MCB8760578.1 UDP-3-O-acyl-N-acetylglucosamine deacetylase [Plankto
MSINSEYTLKEEFSCSGVGLHTGVNTTVRVLPANIGEGRYFVRVDLPENPKIPAILESVLSTTLSTELGTINAKVRTVEHLLAALTGMGIDHARIEIDGPEVPLLDGSAQNWVEAIATVGRQPLDIPSQDVPTVQITKPLSVQQGDGFVVAFPASETRFTYGIDFSVPAIGNQWYSYTADPEIFAREIAPARTFTLEAQVEQLARAGLIQGGSLDNAIVCGKSGWLNPPLRYANEPVRHKILDLVGDLSLLGFLPQAHYLAYKAGHHLHVQLVQEISK